MIKTILNLHNVINFVFLLIFLLIGLLSYLQTYPAKLPFDGNFQNDLSIISKKLIKRKFLKFAVISPKNIFFIKLDLINKILYS